MTDFLNTILIISFGSIIITTYKYLKPPSPSERRILTALEIRFWIIKHLPKIYVILIIVQIIVATLNLFFILNYTLHFIEKDKDFIFYISENINLMWIVILFTINLWLLTMMVVEIYYKKIYLNRISGD